MHRDRGQCEVLDGFFHSAQGGGASDADKPKEREQRPSFPPLILRAEA